jgi:histidinol-phosphate aminotransferase
LRAENVIVGNGSDELLALAVRAFVEPGTGVRAVFHAELFALSGRWRRFTEPDANRRSVAPGFHGAQVIELKRGKAVGFKAALTLITTPNAPSGRAISTEKLDELCAAQKGVVVLDEAYVDFAKENAMGLGAEISARDRVTNIFQGVFAVFSARRVHGGKSDADRGDG